MALLAWGKGDLNVLRTAHALKSSNERHYMQWGLLLYFLSKKVGRTLFHSPCGDFPHTFWLWPPEGGNFESKEKANDSKKVKHPSAPLFAIQLSFKVM